MPPARLEFAVRVLDRTMRFQALLASDRPTPQGLYHWTVYTTWAGYHQVTDVLTRQQHTLPPNVFGAIASELVGC